MARFSDVFVDVDGPALRFLEVMKDSSFIRISALLATELGVFPFLSGAIGLAVKGAKILTISVLPHELESIHFYLEH